MRHERTRTRRRWLAVACALGAAACGPLVDADPMPSPSPEGGLILVSASSALRDGPSLAPVGLIGLARAVAGAGVVEITNTADATVTIVTSSAEGTFAALLQGAANDRLQIVFRESGAKLASDPITVVVGTFAPVSGGLVDGAPEIGREDATNAWHGPNEAYLAISAPDGDGDVTVRGANLPVGLSATLGNQRTGDIAAVTVAADGTVQASIRGAIGDTLVILVRVPGLVNTSLVTSGTVPAPKP